MQPRIHTSDKPYETSRPKARKPMKIRGCDLNTMRDRKAEARFEKKEKRFSGLVTLIQYILFFGGIWWSYNETEMFRNDTAGGWADVYWWVMASVWGIWLMIVSLPTNDGTGFNLWRFVLSPVGRHVYDNYAEYKAIENSISNSLVRKMKDEGFGNS